MNAITCFETLTMASSRPTPAIATMNPPRIRVLCAYFLASSSADSDEIRIPAVAAVKMTPVLIALNPRSVWRKTETTNVIPISSSRWMFWVTSPRTPHTLHDPHQPRRPMAPFGHEVDHTAPRPQTSRNCSQAQASRASNDESSSAPRPRARAATAHGAHRPLATSAERHGRGVKARQAQPVHRPVTTNQRSILHVTDQPIVLDTHKVSLSSLIATSTVGVALKARVT